MTDVDMDIDAIMVKLEKKVLDGIEEWGLVEWLPQAYIDSPKKTGIMAGSLGVQRDAENHCVRIGGGGEASDYILKQEMDRSLRHPVGKAGFIGDTFNDKISSLPDYVNKHL